MSTFLNDVNPDLQDTLAHFGVKGMKWGVKRAQRKERNQQIKTARRNIRDKENDLMDTVRKADKAKTAGERAKLDKLATKKAKDLFDDPDQLTASRMTSGEKWINGIMITAAIGVAGAAGAAQHL